MIQIKINWLYVLIIGSYLADLSNESFKDKDKNNPYLVKSKSVYDQMKCDDQNVCYKTTTNNTINTTIAIQNIINPKILGQKNDSIVMIKSSPIENEFDFSTKNSYTENRTYCNIPDDEMFFTIKDNTTTRYKRYSLHGRKWSNTHLTWAYITKSRNNDNYLIERGIKDALNVWSEASSLTFEKLSPSSEVDLKFHFYTKVHPTDSYPFDGKGMVLGHAFYPEDGEIHFDDDEDFDSHEGSQTTGKLSMLVVFAHEVGHALGLRHSDVGDALMAPSYTKFDMEFKLPNDDLHAIQALYGSGKKSRTYAPTSRPRTTPPPYNPEPTTETTYNPSKRPTHAPAPPEHATPDSCFTSFDAVTNFRGEWWFFKDKYYWRLKKNGQHVDQSYPYEYKYSFIEDVTSVDSAFETKRSSLLIFSGTTYQEFNFQDKPIKRNLTDLKMENVSHVDAAMLWKVNGRIYLFSGDQYWRLQEDGQSATVEIDYPRDNSVWRGLPPNTTITSVVSYSSTITYFFSGKVYWIFDNLKMRIVSPPLSTAAFWMDCPGPTYKVLHSSKSPLFNLIEVIQIILLSYLLLFTSFLIVE